MPRRFSTRIRVWFDRSTRRFAMRSLADLHNLCTARKAVDPSRVFVLLLIAESRSVPSRPMMRINRGLFIVLFGASVFVACSFGGSQGNDPTPDASGGGGASCGDGTCAASEVNNCPADCGSGGNGSGSAVCGNGQCETTKGETSASCPTDCSSQGSGSGSGSGSGTCPADPNECLGCAFTGMGCPTGLDMNSCLTCLIGGGGGFGDLLCDGGAADGTCSAAETHDTCPSDCP
jgi:hypothetical protein